MISIKWKVSTLLAIAAIVGTAFAGETERPLSAQLKLEGARGKAGETILEASLTNLSAVPISVYQHALPWGNRYSIVLLAAEAKMPNRTLEQSFPFDDLPAAKVVEIGAGATIRGTILLGSFFKDLPSEITKSSLVVLWKYQLRTVDGKQLPVMTGVVELPRKKP